MLWSAYEELCALGADHEAQQYLGAGAGAATRLFSSHGASTSGNRGGAPPTATGGTGMPSPTSFQPVATPSVGVQQQHAGGSSPGGTGLAPMSTAATKTGLGAMFSWMDGGRQRGTAGTAGRVRASCFARLLLHMLFAWLLCS